MKKILHIILPLLLLGGCAKYDNSAVKADVAELQNRIAALETLCERLNTNIASMQTIAEGLEARDYLTSVIPIVESGVTVGYRLTYNSGKQINLYQGTDGADGRNGQKGVAGDNGADGVVPSITITLYEGRYYWSLNGTLLRDSSGNLIAATGQGGATGATVIVPQLRINPSTRCWEISYDSGATWIVLGNADGAASAEVFKAIDNTSADYLSITLDDDSEIRIPKVNQIGITTSCNSLTIAPAASAEIGYTLSGEFVEAAIETIVSERGWQAVATPTATKAGKITVTAPATESSCEILIIVYNNIASTAIHKITVSAAND